MKLENILRNTAIIGLSAKLILGAPDFSTLNDPLFQTAVAYAESQYVDEVTDETYEEKVYKSDKPSLVCFILEPGLEKKHRLRRFCEYFSKVLEKLADEYHHQINFFEYRLGEEYLDESLNTDENNIDYHWDELYQKYNVNSQIPIAIMYDKNGRVIDMIGGVAPPNKGQINNVYKILSEKWVKTNLIDTNREWTWKSHGSQSLLQIPCKPKK